MKPSLYCLLLLGALSFSSTAWCGGHSIKPQAPLSWGDQGDGTYRNPVLFADYSDPDVIRVGEEYFLVASDFHFMGIQILRSRDLVNWSLAGRLFDHLEIDAKYSRMQAYAEGTWAPTLRHHNGRFLLYVCTPHDGLFRWSAEKPEGPWQMDEIKRVDKWEDPCPFWDDDGKAYLVHSIHGAGPLILHRMSEDGLRLLDDGVEIYRGPVAEGPKLFKREGWYYISLPEGGVTTGGQTLLRSKNLYGPYERREVLPPGSPHQGGLVETSTGESWFIGYLSTGSFGRVAHLLPVRWGEEGWPVFGKDGLPITEGRKPALPVQPLEHPARDDDFSSSALSLQWQWNHNPVQEAWSLTERPGKLRMKLLPAESLQFARNSLTQRLWGPAGRITVTIDTGGLAAEGKAGLAFMSGKVFNALEVVSTGGALVLRADDATVPLQGRSSVQLRAEYTGSDARLSYSLDGKVFTPIGKPVVLKFGQWKGARIALCAYGPQGGHVDFDDFRYEVRP